MNANSELITTSNNYNRQTEAQSNASRQNYNNSRRQNHDRNQTRNNNYNRSYQKSRQQKLEQEEPNESENNLEQDSQVSKDQKNKIYNRRKLISISSSTNQNEISCICCLHELYTFVYYSCSHFVCLNCAIKMRLLCQKLDCPVCRQESKQVLCTKKQIDTEKNSFNLNEIFNQNKNKIKQLDELSGINIDEDLVRKEYEEIVSNRCDVCPHTLPPFRSFQELDYHIRKVHRRFYCELCMENLKLFPYERKHYTREELAMHKRNGDRDDYSFKGHPLCEYCDQRFFDRDELYRHFRRDHYFCHFCDSDGHEEYYNDYSQLRQHFLKTHFLCELDNCSQNAAETHEYVVFRTELDFQAHKKQKHAKTKSESKNFGKLNIEFNLNNSARDRHRRQNRYHRNHNRDDSNDETYEPTRTQSKLQTTEIDPNVLRMSREQFERDEAERKKQQLKQQYEKHQNEQEQQQSQLVSEPESNPPQTPTVIPEPAQAQTTWRNLISSGPTPKINKEAEFPSLSASNQGASQFLSLADLGASISSTVWKTKQETKKELKPKQESKSKPEPKPEPKIQPKVELKSEFKPESKIEPKTEPKQEKKNKQKPKSKTPNDSVEPKKEPVSLEPPPGFEKNIETPAPLPILTGPPPGFEKNETKKEEKIVEKKNEFIKPDNYDQRNLDLNSRLFSLFGTYNQDEFEKFKKHSIQFKNSELKADEYLTISQKLLDLPLSSDSYANKKNLDLKGLHIQFLDLIQEMLILMPNYKKQNELYEAYISLVDKLIKSESKSSSSSLKWADKNAIGFSMVNKIQKCCYCDQFFLNTEFNFHQLEHHGKEISGNKSQIKLEEQVDDFPALNKPSSSAWSFPKQEKIAEPIKKISQVTEDFPALSSTLVNNTENRYSSLPTASLFSNPSSHLSLINKKKHRLQK